MRNKPKPIRSILEETLKALEIEAPLKTYSIFGAWKEIVGEAIALQTRPRSIRNRILFIDVSHPTWMQQLQFLRHTLLEKINTFLGESRIEDIRFRLGKIPSPPSPPSNTLLFQNEGLNEEILNRIEGLLRQIEDEEVRGSLRDLLIKGAKLEQYRRRSK
jgi:hypothetical protein